MVVKDKDFIDRMKGLREFLGGLTTEEFAYLALCNGFEKDYITKTTGVKFNKPHYSPLEVHDCGTGFDLVQKLSGTGEEYVCRKCGIVSDSY
ncbi:MAG: hypothetical protein HZB68_05795 [Candidatus Aenigmarchaeota archaeon]|nr:hypothetical protein [Candidatus Aenigmarchaeota archaeon]